MSLLTQSQQEFLTTRKIKIDKTYSIPDESFTIYDKPIYSSGEYVFLPENKTTQGIFMTITDIKDGFVAGYLNVGKPKKYWFSQSEFESRHFNEIVFLYLFCWLPMVAYNLIKNFQA